MNRSVALLRALTALAVTAFLLVGVPFALVRTVGWPLPTALPSPGQVQSALDVGLSDQFWLKLLAVVVWIAWIQLTVALVREVAALVRGRAVRPRLGDAWAHSLAAHLVGAIALVGAVIGPTPGAGARPLLDALEALDTRPVAAAVTSPASEAPDWLGTGGAPEPTHVVERGESLSSIAAHELGDQRSWPAIWVANRGRRFGSRVFHDPNLILPGWELQVPGARPPVVAAEPSAAEPDPAEPDAAEPDAAEPDAAEPVAPVLIPPPLVITAPRSTEPSTAPVTTQPSGTTSPAVAGRVSAGGTVAAAPSADRVRTRSSSSGNSRPTAGPPVWAQLSGALGATLLATGVVASIAGRRRRTLRRATSASTVTVPDPELAPLLTALHATSDAVRTARLELALRALAGRLAHQSSFARPVALRIGGGGWLEVVLDRPAMLDEPWTRGDSDRRWILPQETPLTALTDAARDVAPPCPALVGIGQDAGGDGEVYVDLEALPLLDVGCSSAADDLVRLVMATLANTPLADELKVIVVGCDVHGLEGRHRLLAVEGLSAAVAQAEAMTAGIALLSSGEPSTFRLRAVAGHEPWEPVVVVVPALRHRTAPEPTDRAMLSKLAGMAAAHRGVAVIGADVGDTPWRLRRHAGTWRLDPLGWTVRPHRLSEVELADIGAVLEAASEPPAEPMVTPTVAPPTRVPQWSLMARVLGTVDVVNSTGRPVCFDRAKSLELVVWLAQHGGTATRSGARSALWGLDVSNGAFSNVVSEARRAMARLVTPPEGQDWLARTYGEQLPLHPQVVLDADLVAAHLDRARTLPDEAAIAELRTALGYVRGAPYAGASYLWPDAEALPSTLTLLVINVASALAERCLAVGDLDGVFSATAVGLEVLPGHEELVGLRMRAHAAKGDLAAVRGEFASYEQAVVNDPWAEGEIAPKLIALREELAGQRSAIAGS